MGTSILSGKPDNVLGGGGGVEGQPYLGLASHPRGRGEVMPLVTSR